MRRLADRIGGPQVDTKTEAGEDPSEPSPATSRESAPAVPPPDPRRDQPDESERIARKAAITGLLWGRW